MRHRLLSSAIVNNMPQKINLPKHDKKGMHDQIDPQEPCFFHPSELVPPPPPKPRVNNWMKADGPCFFEYQCPPLPGPQLPPLKPFR